MGGLVILRREGVEVATGGPRGKEATCSGAAATSEGKYGASKMTARL